VICAVQQLRGQEVSRWLPVSQRANT